MEVITIVVKENSIEVVDGRVKSARLKYYTDTLEIYVFGNCPVKMRETVMYHAFEQCRARHIRINQLKSMGWV